MSPGKTDDAKNRPRTGGAGREIDPYRFLTGHENHWFLQKLKRGALFGRMRPTPDISDMELRYWILYSEGMSQTVLLIALLLAYPCAKALFAGEDDNPLLLAFFPTENSIFFLSMALVQDLIQDAYTEKLAFRVTGCRYSKYTRLDFRGIVYMWLLISSSWWLVTVVTYGVRTGSEMQVGRFSRSQ